MADAKTNSTMTHEPLFRGGRTAEKLRPLTAAMNAGGRTRRKLTFQGEMLLLEILRWGCDIGATEMCALLLFSDGMLGICQAFHALLHTYTYIEQITYIFCTETNI